MEDIHTRIDQFVDLVKGRDCYKQLLKQTTLMESNEEVLRLSNIFSLAQMNYSDGLKHYQEGSEELNDLYLKMREAKMDLDDHPIVKDYYKILSEVNEPLNYVQFKMLSLFKNKHGHNCK